MVLVLERIIATNVNAKIEFYSIFIVPTYNEIENIEALITAIFNLSKSESFDILIVDDNSPDKTALKVEALQKKYPSNLFIEKREKKAGLGTAYIHGFKWALQHNYSYIFEMDADFSHNPMDLLRLKNTCVTENLDLVIGSRYVKGVNVVNWPMSRVLLSYLASKYVRLITRMPIHDTTAGFVCTDRAHGTSKMSKGIISEAIFGVIQMKINSLLRRNE